MISRTASIARVVGRTASARLLANRSTPVVGVASQQLWSLQHNLTNSSSVQNRSMVTISDSPTAHEAFQKSCYVQIGFTIPDDHLVFEAVQRFAAYDIGCLITTDSNGTLC